MSARLPRYQAYRDSSIEWIEQVPTEWVEVRFRYLTSITTGDKDTVNREEDGEYPFFVRSQVVEQISTYSFDGEAILTAGDGDIGKIFHHYVGKFDFHQRVYKFSNFKGIAGRFLYYYLFANLANEVIKLSAKTTVDSLRMPMLLNFKVAFPSLAQQTQIARFLDYETAKIDALIEKQEQLIALLKEKRQAVISHAVTKGLNPDAPMRDSGVVWLGEVPAHWEVTRAKYLFNFVTSGSRGWAEFYSDEGSLFFRIANLTRDTIEPKLLSIQNVTPPHGSEGERSRIKEGDLLISITADLGSVCVADERISGGYVSQHVSLCRPNQRVSSSRWLGYLVLSDVVKEQLLGSGYGGTKIQLSLEDIRELVIARPSPVEQEQIVRYIDTNLVAFSKLIAASDEQVDLLQERRTALISAAVTGKIDVRGWKLPESKELKLM